MADDDNKPDERPRPKYGELAPEGWVWHPPADAGRLDTSKPAPADNPQPVSAPDHHAPARPDAPHAYPPPPGSPAARLRTDAPRWNLTFTLVLIVFGFLGMSYSIGTLNAFPAAIQMMHATDNLKDYVPAPPVAPLLTAGSIIQAVIWAISTGLSVWLLTKKRISFYIPLIAGMIALIALFVIVSLVLTTDTTLLDFYGGATTPTPSTTP